MAECRRASAAMAAVALVLGSASAVAPPASAIGRVRTAQAAVGWRTTGAGGEFRAASVAGSPATASAGVPLAARGALSRTLGRADPRYRPVRARRGWLARNPAQRLAAAFTRHGVAIRSGALTVTMAVKDYGDGSRLRPVASAAPTVAANLVRFRQGPLTGWYANGPAGLEQGFTLTVPPPGRAGSLLRLDLALTGDARAIAAPGGGVIFRHGGQTLHYGGLTVTDASGRRLRARLAVHARDLELLAATAGASYPLRIDPVIYSQARFTASDGQALDEFGFATAISGNVIAVGAAFSNDFPSEGAVYVFTQTAGTWAQTAKLTASGSPASNLGWSVAISGSTIVAGAPDTHGTGGTAQGTAYVFSESAGGWADATQTAKLTASDGGAFDLLGTSVAISGTAIAAGAPRALGTGHIRPGAVYVFTEPAGGWADATQTAELSSSASAASDNFGQSVAIAGTTLVAGANLENNFQGAAYVFTEPAGGWADATQTARLTASDGAANDQFGYSVAISGSAIVVGAPEPGVNDGAAYVFTRTAGNWAQAAELTGSDGGGDGQFGWSVAISGTVIIAGAPFAIVNEQDGQGAAYVFEEPAGGWASATQTAELTASDGASGDELGWSVATSGAAFAAGATYDTVPGDFVPGAEYVFAPAQAVTSITTQLAVGSLKAGQAVRDSATLSGEAGDAGGSVDYRVYDALADCQADTTAFPHTAPSRGTAAGGVSVTNGEVPDSGPMTFASVGTYYWAAFYSGDDNDLAAASSCEPLAVIKATPKVTVKLSASPPAFATAALSEASPSAQGSIYYEYYPSLVVCRAETAAWTGNPGELRGYAAGISPVRAGQVLRPSQVIWSPYPGTLYWVAFYSGDANDEPAASTCGSARLTER